MTAAKRALTVTVNPTAVAGHGDDPESGRREATRMLWQRTLPQTLARVACLEEATAALLEQRLDPDLRGRARRAAHQLAGSVGCFGFVDASARARAVEQRLGDDGPLDEPAVLELCQDVGVIREELDPDLGRPATVAGELEHAQNQVAVVTADDAWAEQIRAEAGVRGLRVWRATDAALRDTTPPQPDAVLIDLAADADPTSLLCAVTACAPAPVVALCASDEFADRAALAHAGVRRVLSADATARDAVDAIGDALATTHVRGVTAVVWFDDPVDGDAVALGLRELGMTALTATGAADAWGIVGEHLPGLIVAAAAPEEVADLCAVVRSDARWARLPVIAVAPEGSAASRRLHEAGADDVLPTPAAVTEIVARARWQFSRAQLAARDAEIDPLTGLPNDAGAYRYLERLVSMARRHDHTLAIAALRIDDFARLNDLHGRAAGDEVLQAVGHLLRTTFRGEDVAARLGGGEFLIALYRSGRDDAAARLRGVAAGAAARTITGAHGSPVQLSLSVGVAEFPADGRDEIAVRRAATDALRRARLLGGGAVSVAGANPRAAVATSRADIVVVEDDDVLANLLEHAFETRGWRTVRFADGHEALRCLTGPEPQLRARLVVLDVDLPGLDGFTVLRRLSEAGTLDATRVLVLTVHSTEAETLTALETGAFDHVGKPFSLPVLLERVRRSLVA